MPNTLYLPELREMLAENDSEQLREFCAALHAARTAEFMEGLTAAESWAVLQHAEPGRRGEIFGYFDFDKQVELIETADRAEIGRLIASLPADDRVDLLKDCRPEVVEQLLPLIPVGERRDILRLTSYHEGTAGAMMTSQFARLSADCTVREALQEITRQAETLETIYYLYVVDAENHLQGAVSARQLVSTMGRPDTPIRDIMERGMVSVDVHDDQDHVAEEVARYDLLAIPVVDEERHMLGIITHDDVIDLVREEAARDVQKIAAVQPLETGYLETKLLTLTRKRGLWLTVLFFAGLVTTYTLHTMGEHLNAIEWLAVFIPLLISTGGNSGSQSATLIITSLNRDELSLADWGRVVRRELTMGLMMGSALGAIGFLVALTFHPHHNPIEALAVPLTLVLVVTAGTVVGSSLPLVFHAIGLDPALMSNPCVAGIIDILGIVILINVAMWLVAAAGGS
jgi:magnesium transporter